MPGSTPATSQLDWLISMTAMIVLFWTITLDGYAASHRAVHELKADGWLPMNTKLRSSKFLDNLSEQDHRGLKQRIAGMLRFKAFRNAVITIAGIELLHRIPEGTIRTGTFRRSRSSCA